MELTLGPRNRRVPLRRLLELGAGGVLALAYWGGVGVMLWIAAALILLVIGPGIILVWLAVCAAAWGFGLFLCVVAGLLTIARPARRVAVAFLIGSALANAVLIAAVLVAYLPVSGYITW